MPNIGTAMKACTASGAVHYQRHRREKALCYQLDRSTTDFQAEADRGRRGIARLRSTGIRRLREVRQTGTRVSADTL